ncbi:hypothetical protein HN51_070206 [Arachis hypogaea]|uniref:(+)-cis,cis-nepetalactol synthase NEPS3 n=1 Tax=Arachis hypogaea TaxID=3818 RepID=UPI0011057224|nr:(-)-isopiperitenol/(-)-carveol dehydrogenase, mitochondrial-like [Arachis hypogaea]QHO12556.1 (-)-isopiperitenol/(-)-carveol dehydrogenase [Arachis hypogaea]
MEKTSASPSGGKKLAGKVAIVTGGASGIGEATVCVFADEGALMVVVADVQDDLGNQVAASIGTHRCTFLHCDVTDEDQVKSLVQPTVYNHGQLDIMFSNAGILSPAEHVKSYLVKSKSRKIIIK